MKLTLLLFHLHYNSLPRQGKIRIGNLPGYILLVIFLIGFSNSATAQLTEVWDTGPFKHSSGSGTDNIKQEVDKDKNLIILGSSMTLFKYDQAGKLIWEAKYSPGTDTDRMWTYDLWLDATGNSYISGMRLTTGGTYEDMLAKFSAQGQLIWSKNFNRSVDGVVEVNDVFPNADGTVFLTGAIKEGSVTKMVTQKLNAKGEVIWSSRYEEEGDYPIAGAVVAADGKGNLYALTRIYYGYTRQLNDIQLIKFNAETGVQLSKFTYPFQATPQNHETPVDLFITSSGSFYIVAETEGEPYVFDIVLYRVDASGNLEWAKIVGEKHENDYFEATLLENEDLIMLCRQTRYRNIWDHFITKFDKSGNQLWNHKFNVYENVEGQSVIRQFTPGQFGLSVNGEGEIAIAGSYSIFNEPPSWTSAIVYREYPKLMLTTFSEDGKETWRHVMNEYPTSRNYSAGLRFIDNKNLYFTGQTSGSETSEVATGQVAMKFADCSGFTASAGADKEICTGGNVQLQATGGTTYSWAPATGLSATNVANPVASPTETTTYTVTVTNPDGCTGTDQVVVKVDTAPTASITVNGSTSLCAGGSVSLEANAGTGFTYQWLRNGNIINNATGNIYAATTAGDYTVIVKNTGGCSTTSAAVKVTVVPAVTASAGVDKEICTGENVQLQASGGTTYSWAPATGLSATNIANPVASPSATTTYTVTVTNADGCTDTDEVIVNVNAKPTATVTAASETTFCQGGSVVLTANSGTDYSYQWLKNGTPINQATAKTYSATTAGDYSVIVENDGKCSATSAIVKVSVTTAVTASAGTDKEICTGSNVQLQASGGTSYSWSPATGLSATNVANPIASPSTTTTYTVTVSNASGCSATDQVVVKVSASPAATITANGATTLCEGGSLVLNANQGTNYSYQWYKDGNPINQATGSSFTTYAGGEFTVKVTMGSGCTATSSPLKVTVIKPAMVVAGEAQSVCDNAAAFTLSGFSPAGGTWSGKGVSAAGLFNPATAGVGTHTLTYTVNQGDCSATATKTITVTPAVATPGTINGTATICSGATNLAYTISAVAGAESYTWTVPTGFTITSGQGTTSIKVTAGSNGGNITVAATNGCGTSASSTIAVNVSTITAATITLEGNTTFCEGGSVTLKATAGSNYSYQWLRNGTAISGETTANYNATTSGNYTVRVTNGSCAETSASVAVNVTAAISNNAIASGNQSVCAGATVANLQGSIPTGGAGNYSYQWQQSSDGTNFSSITSATSQNYKPGNLSTTTWFRRVVTAGGCSSTSDAIKVTINAAPTVTLSAFDKVCTDDEVLTLTGGQPTGGNYSGPGISNGVFNPATAGVGAHTITYTYTNTSGCAATATQTIVVEAECNVTGVEDEEPTHKFAFFPNPARDKLNLEVELPDRTDVTIQLIDARGSVILQQEYTAQVGAFKTILKIENKARGMYFLRFTTKDGSYNRKVLLW